jgi:predicted HAD superfamily hydrolase
MVLVVLLANGENQSTMSTAINTTDIAESQSTDQFVPSCDDLQRFVTQMHKDQKKDFAQDQEILHTFNKNLDKYQVISFDIFDTLLVRTVDHPSNVYFFLENEPIFKKFTYSASVPVLRSSAENLSRQLLYKSTGSCEVNLSEIYAVFCKQNNVPLEYVSAFVEAEENVERKLCVPNPFFTDLYQHALLAGKRVVIASDMYLRKSFLLILLHEKGFPISEENLFVSSDLRVSKRTGELYTKMMQSLEIPAAAILHVGDHPISDFGKPKQMGISALLHTHKASSDQFHACYSAESASVQSYLRGMIRAARHTTDQHEDFWGWLGYRVFGPLTTGFCYWLKDQFYKDSIERAWFLLRDGELPYRVWEELFADDHAMQISLLPSSRRAFVLPALEIAPQFVFPNLVCCIQPLPVRKYLERLKVPAQEFTAEFRACGFDSLNEMVDGRIDHQKLFNLFQRPRVLKALVARSRQERRLLEAFFEQNGLFEKKSLAIIDLGWNGTIQKAMHLLLTQRVHPLRFKGYYFATQSSFAQGELSGVEHAAYLAQNGHPAQIDQLIRSCYVLLEIVYSSLAGSLVCFKQSTKKIEGIFQASDKTDEQSTMLTKIHEGALRYAREFKYAHRQYNFSAIPSVVAAEELFRLFTHPTPEEAERIGGITHCENYGMDSFRYVAKFTAGMQPQELLENFKMAYWKTGLLGQNNQQAMALRNLLWLMEAEKDKQ